MRVLGSRVSCSQCPGTARRPVPGYGGRRAGDVGELRAIAFQLLLRPLQGGRLLAGGSGRGEQQAVWWGRWSRARGPREVLEAHLFQPPQVLRIGGELDLTRVSRTKKGDARGGGQVGTQQGRL